MGILVAIHIQTYAHISRSVFVSRQLNMKHVNIKIRPHTHLREARERTIYTTQKQKI